MKKTKIFLVFIAVMILTLSLGIFASAEGETYKSGVFTYTVTDGKATITGGDKSFEGHLVIPESIDGYPVVRIETQAFFYCYGITDVTIPSSIKSMGSQIFQTSLENVYTESLEAWFDISFEGILSNPLGCGENLYIGGELLTDLVLPEGLKVIPDYAFYGCDSLVSVTLPESLEVLGEWAFEYCDNIKSVYADSVEWWIKLYESTEAAGQEVRFCSILGPDTDLYLDGEILTHLVIPESVTTLSALVFECVSTIESVTFHKDFESIAERPFPYSHNLKAVYVPDLKLWFKICSSLNRNFGMGKGIESLYINNELVVDLVIPEDIDTVVADSFIYNQNLRSITITSPIKEFETGWATGCKNLEAIYVDSFETWNACGFSVYSENPISRVDYLYIDGKPVTDLVIPEGTTSISEFLFNNYKALKSVTIPGSVEKIGVNAFPHYLENVYVDSLESWLKLCTSMSDVASNSQWHPMQYAENFYIGGELLTNLVIPENITEIPKLAFYNVKSIESVTLHKNVTKIAANAFTSCTGFKTLYVPDLDYWFNINKSCSGKISPYGLNELYIAGELFTDYVAPEGLTAIPEYAFSGYSGLKSVTLPASVVTVGKDAFMGCSRITEIHSPSLEHWLSIVFLSIESNPITADAKLYIGGEFLEELRVPESIKDINNYAFYGYKHLKAFYVNGNSLSIYSKAFGPHCSDMSIYAESLEDWLKVNENFYTNAAYETLMDCGATLYIAGEKPVEIIIPDTVKKIPWSAFQGCKSIRKITIPATTSVGKYAFKHSGLREIVYGSLTEKTAPVMAVDGDGLEDCLLYEKITFGYGVKSVSKNAFKDIKNLKEIVFLNGIESIGEQAFYNTGIKTLTIPSTVKSIGKRAFTYSKALESLTLGDKTGQPAVMAIDNAAFTYCTKLTKVTFNSGIKTMGENVFYKSYEITDVYVNDLKAYLEMELPLNLGTGSESNPARFADNIYINGEIATDVVIPEGVTRICAYAFSRCESIETVKFPSTLKYIDDGAFESCFNLRGLTLPDSLERIGESAFFGCKSITSVNFGYNLKDVGWMAFEYCVNLRIVYMYPEQIELGDGAFVECNKIDIILYTGTKEAWNKLLNENKGSGLEGVAVYYRFRPESLYAPEEFDAVQTTDSITLAWSKINGVTGYRVYVKNGNNWKTVKTLTQNTFKVSGLPSGNKYTFAVKAYINTGALVLWSPEYITLDTATKAVRPSKVTAAQNESAIRLTWPVCPGATGYRIYYKSGTEWKVSVSTTSAVSHTFTGLKPGAKYTFAVRPYIKNGSTVIWSDYIEFMTATKPAAVTAKLTSPSKGKLTLTWNKVNGADGYQVYYKTSNGSYKLYKTYSGVQNLTFLGLKSGTKYTFAVRAGIRTSGGNIFGGYKEVPVTVK